jgi:hypothetical protein
MRELEVGKSTEHDVFILDGYCGRCDQSADLQRHGEARNQELTILREQVVRSSDNELGHKSTKFLQLLLAFLLDLIRRVRITATNNGILEILPEVAFGPEEVGIRKVEEREIFRKIILNRCS